MTKENNQNDNSNPLDPKYSAFISEVVDYIVSDDYHNEQFHGPRGVIDTENAGLFANPVAEGYGLGSASQKAHSSRKSSSDNRVKLSISDVYKNAVKDICSDLHSNKPLSMIDYKLVKEKTMKKEQAPDYKFISANHIGSSKNISKIYLLKRAKDYQQFIADLNMQGTERGDAICIFENGYSAVIYDNGKIGLFEMDGNKPETRASASLIRNFDTWEMFAAYYLAKFW